jgi:beta-phosphoglucomutase-like phosphatase (HAD superfamily)
MTRIACVALHTVILDVSRYRALYPAALGQVMASVYGGTVMGWSAAFKQVRADWDDYYADLDLAGDDGVADMWEGLFRTTRALFRLAGHGEPGHDELTALARSLPGRACARIDTVRDDARARIAALKAQHYTLVVYAALSAEHIRGLLIGGTLQRDIHDVIGLDTAERFDFDAAYWQAAALRFHVHPSGCLVIDPRADVQSHARAVGMNTL